MYDWARKNLQHDQKEWRNEVMYKQVLQDCKNRERQ